MTLIFVILSYLSNFQLIKENMYYIRNFNTTDIMRDMKTVFIVFVYIRVYACYPLSYNEHQNPVALYTTCSCHD